MTDPKRLTDEEIAEMWADVAENGEAIVGLWDHRRIIALLAEVRAARDAPPRPCPGSGTAAGNLYLSATGRGRCGMCGQDVAVAPGGLCETHPWAGVPRPSREEIGRLWVVLGPVTSCIVDNQIDCFAAKRPWPCQRCQARAAIAALLSALGYGEDGHEPANPEDGGRS